MERQENAMEFVPNSDTIHNAPTYTGDTPPASRPDDASTDLESSTHYQQKEGATDSNGDWDWDKDPTNPYNWPVGRKWRQIAMIASTAFLSSYGSSVMSAAHAPLMQEFGVNKTEALVPLATYVFALALGPVVGGPLSETIGRWPVYLIFNSLAALFTLGCGLVQNFVGLCILRFLAGFFLGPPLAVGGSVLTETFRPVDRALPAILFILMPLLGPGFGPIIGSVAVSRHDWRWTQWTMLFLAAFCLLLNIFASSETYHPILKSRRAKQLGKHVPDLHPPANRIKEFLTITLFRPIHMLFVEPLVGWTCLYMAVVMGTLYTFFAAVPFVFSRVYHFTLEQQGLVFFSLVIGCLLSIPIALVCDIVFYRPQIPHFAPANVPPEYRLFSAMVGSTFIPISQFWFAWSARADVSWASPAVALLPFGCGTILIFIGLLPYLSEAYGHKVSASALSSNSLARYLFAGAFPLFVLDMYEKLGINWGCSLLAFLSLGLLPVPWVFFKYGKQLRERSKYGAGDSS